MSRQIQAVYEKGVLRPLEPLQMDEGEELDVVLLPRRKGGTHDAADEQNGNGATIHPLTLIARLAVDTGVTDLAERHDTYAHGKLEG
jgi:predicted DNA-binding antitoxin AbrB/MazE fold protein